MNITTSEYKITVNSQNDYVLQFGSIIEEHETKPELIGTIRYGSSLYYPKLEQVFNRILKEKLATDETITSFEAVEQAVAALTEEVKALHGSMFNTAANNE